MSTQMALCPSSDLASRNIPHEEVITAEALINSVEKRLDPRDFEFMTAIRASGADFPRADPRFALFEYWNGLKQDLEDKILAASCESRKLNKYFFCIAQFFIKLNYLNQEIPYDSKLVHSPYFIQQPLPQTFLTLTKLKTAIYCLTSRRQVKMILLRMIV